MSHYQKFTPPFPIPDSWEWVTIGDISSSILYGVSESAKDNGQYKLLRITDIQNNQVNWGTVPSTDFPPEKAVSYILHKGDILFARTGATVGKSYLVNQCPPNTIYASYLIRIQTFQNIESAYLKFFFESGFYWQQISEGSVGIGQPNVNGTSLSLLKIPIPPKSEQMRIVGAIQNVLSTVDSIEVAKQRILTSVNQAKSKILELAMQGKLVPQDPTDKPATDMLRRVNPKARIITDNPHYPQLPDNWVWISIDDLNQYKSKSINPSDYPTDIFDLYSVPIYPMGQPETIMGKEIGSTKQSVRKGDVLLCKINPHLNRVWTIEESSPNIQIASSEWIIIRSNMYSPYLKWMFSAPFFRKMLCSQVSGVGGSLTRAQPAVVKKYLIPIPPYSEQVRIANRITELDYTLNEINSNLDS